MCTQYYTYIIHAYVNLLHLQFRAKQHNNNLNCVYRIAIHHHRTLAHYYLHTTTQYTIHDDNYFIIQLIIQNKLVHQI